MLCVLWFLTATSPSGQEQDGKVDRLGMQAYGDRTSRTNRYNVDLRTIASGLNAAFKTASEQNGGVVKCSSS